MTKGNAKADTNAASLFPPNDADLPRQAIAAGAPLYEVVKRYLSEAILLGKWPPGTVLPSEVALAQSFGIAVGTVRRALSDLTREGLLSRRRKTGTVVTGRTPHHSLRSFFQYFRLHKADGSLVRSIPNVLSVGTFTPTAEEIRQLRLAPGAFVLRIHRLRVVDGRPVMRDRLALPAARLPDFPSTPDRVPELLYIYLLERYGIRVTVVREQLTARLADAEDLELLELASPAAILRIDEVTYDQTGEPIILATRHATTADHMYVNEIR